ncbi:PP2C family protein-serine/threonine phosphatase [Orenia marismortui]|uniref:Stage 0 sporulation protein A homolog n=1 Tax=Orenia marismortui TaxID=46469 RepID=A0A4R8HHV8_9FIRM|nr:PP2C family protein-serine/threonine phosphatase [Orenia marismortui]TDX58998.1 response regulator receiver domain-containing protein [Orenia marismortui]
MKADKNKILFNFEDENNIFEKEIFFGSEDQDSEILFAPEDKEEIKKDKASKWKILIVDDEQEIHKITELVLNDVDFEGKGIEFINAYSAKQAKEIIDSESDIAVILLDVVMENEDSGLNLVKYIRDDLKNNLVQIILRTGHSGQAPERELIKAYDINDYKEKTELTSQKLYTTVMTSLRSYYNLKRLKETVATKERIESELEIASKIQVSMLPRSFPPFPNSDEFDIFASMEPARQVGGDFYDFFFISDNKLCLVIGDVSGKGIPAAIFMAITKTLIKSEALKDISPADIFYNVNNALCKDNDESLFVTAFIGIVDLRTGEFEFANAGHNAPLICRDNKGCSYLKSKDTFILGINEDFKYKTETTQLNPNNVLVLYTDGVIESRNNAKEQYSNQRLQELLSELEDKDVNNIEKVVKDDIKSFTKGAHQFDDLTMLILKFNRTSDI